MFTCSYHLCKNIPIIFLITQLKRKCNNYLCKFMKFMHFMRLCIFLNLYNLKPKDMLKQCNEPLMEEFKHTLMADIDSRKGDK